jgi:hypothetical protein
MRERVARTKTQATAWELVKLLTEACPCTEFLVVLVRRRVVARWCWSVPSKWLRRNLRLNLLPVFERPDSVYVEI